MYNTINMDYLDEVALGSNEFKIEIIESFLSKTPASLGQMKECLAKSDYEQIGKIAHKLKTSFSFMGMEDMVALSKLMQDMGLNNQNVSEFPEKIKTLELGFEEGAKELNEELINLKK